MSNREEMMEGMILLLERMKKRKKPWSGQRRRMEQDLRREPFWSE